MNLGIKWQRAQPAMLNAREVEVIEARALSRLKVYFISLVGNPASKR